MSGRICFVLILLCNVFLFCKGSERKESGPILIGVVGAFSGDLASTGLPVRKALVLAAQEINRRGGVLNRRIELLVEDDVCEPELAVLKARKLLKEGVRAVIGHLCSGATRVALDVYAEGPVLVVSPASTNPDLTLWGRYPHFFRTVAHDALQADLHLELLGNLKAKRVAIVHDKGTYGKGLAELVRGSLMGTSIKVVLFDSVTPGGASYMALADRVVRSGVDAIFFGGHYPEAAKLVRGIRERKGDTFFLAGDGVWDSDFIAEAGESAWNVFVSAPVDVSQLESARPVIESYKGMFGQEPGMFSLQAYAALQVVASAMEVSGSVRYGPMADAMRNLMVETPIGAISFDKNGDVVGTGFALYEATPEGFQKAN